MASRGLETTIRIASGENFTTSATTFFMIPTLVESDRSG
jgi:hypothetical protein